MLMHRLRRAALWLLLLPMALVVVPRHMLHECMPDTVAHAHGAHAGDRSDGPQADMGGGHGEVRADCPICHLNIVMAVPPGPATEGWLIGVIGELPMAHVPALATAPHHLLANRGPPARS